MPLLIHARQMLQHEAHARRDAPNPDIVQHGGSKVGDRAGERAAVVFAVCFGEEKLVAAEELLFFFVGWRGGVAGFEGVDPFCDEEDWRCGLESVGWKEDEGRGVEVRIK